MCPADGSQPAQVGAAQQAEQAVGAGSVCTVLRAFRQHSS